MNLCEGGLRVSVKDMIRDSLIDIRPFGFGEVWTIKDELVSIPDADRIDDRVFHAYRSMLIVSNDIGNTNPLTLTVNTAPLSHRVDLKRCGDIELHASRDNLRYDSMAKLRLIQPLLKADLERRVTTISDDGKEDILTGLEELFGLIVEE